MIKDEKLSVSQEGDKLFEKPILIVDYIEYYLILLGKNFFLVKTLETIV